MAISIGISGCSDHIIAERGPDSEPPSSEEDGETVLVAPDPDLDRLALNPTRDIDRTPTTDLDLRSDDPTDPVDDAGCGDWWYGFSGEPPSALLEWGDLIAHGWYDDVGCAEYINFAMCPAPYAEPGIDYVLPSKEEMANWIALWLLESDVVPADLYDEWLVAVNGREGRPLSNSLDAYCNYAHFTVPVPEAENLDCTVVALTWSCAADGTPPVSGSTMAL